jgi:heat shock protein HslJ
MIKSLQTVSILACIILVISCGSLSSSQEKNKANGFSTEFILASYELIAIGERNVESMNLEMHIDPKQKRISGDSGCNRYGYTYQLENEVLDLGFGMATKMYCEDTQAIENEFFKQMSKVNRFIIQGENITFTNENNEVLVTAKTKIIDNE